VRNQIGMLTSNGVQGLVLILLMLGLFLEPRLALWVGMGIPISLAGSMFVMWTMGWTLNQISLIAMILVLGILVDDSVVMGEAIYAHRRRGDPPLAACVNGVREVALPVHYLNDRIRADALHQRHHGPVHAPDAHRRYYCAARLAG
jgi:multidrug efflux pump subunit AcrB